MDRFPEDGGMNSRLHVVTDREGRPVRLFIAADQVSDYKGSNAATVIYWL
ncbi:hypothetical protein LX81_02345 [Palleronia aestuarii]|uniref:Transposase n=1 Tax=Palleronia aestuarii TaxID=568105 RepID=A0A2W7N7H0_9RHOB|nr:hypothetical protein LX81_02345 [Palleronia aestuarii]